MHALLLLAVAWSAASALSTTVQTESGLVEGLQSSLGLSWKGIPYGAPPIGNMRWQQSVQAESWSGVKQTQWFAPGCPQICSSPPQLCPNGTSEDCLYLNVYSPINADSLPVMVWIHGGGFETGSGGMILFDGGFLSNATNTVIVTISYRLGALGFLNTNDFEGQFGVLDQRLALKWVKNNINNFGGNQNRVTLFGQSAGGNSVAFHLISKESWPFFNQIIMESNPSSSIYPQRDASLASGEIFIKSSPCENNVNVTECLLSLSVSQVVSAQQQTTNIEDQNLNNSFTMSWTPWVDGVNVNAQPIELFSNGEFSHVPMIIGDAADEGHSFVYLEFSSAMSFLEFDVIVGEIFNKVAKQVRKQYSAPPNSTNYDYRQSISNIDTDYAFACPNRNIANSVATNDSSLPLYLYLFSHAMSNHSGFFGANESVCNGFACHSIELPFVFGFADYDYTPTAAEVTLGEQVRAYWGNFAWTGNPNNPNLPEWPQFTKDGLWLSLDVPTNTPITYPRSAACDMWDQLGYIF